MALFGNNNDYDRGFGNRGYQQGGGGMMDRAGNSIRRGFENVRDRFDNDGSNDRGWHGGARDGYGVEADESVRNTWDRTGYGNTGMNSTNNYGPQGSGGGYGNTGGYGATGMGNTGWGTSGYATGRNDFNDYDRDFGARGQSFGGGQGMQHGWGGARESFSHNDYDRNFTNRGQSFGNAGYGNTGPAYGAGSNMDYDRGYRGAEFDRSNAGSTGYDRNMKSRTQTDTGDPFGDRAAHTPIRVMRGRFERGMGGQQMGGGQPMGASGMGIDYDRQYKEGLGDDPYYNRNDLSSGGMYRGSQGGYDRNFRNNNDRGWF